MIFNMDLLIPHTFEDVDMTYRRWRTKKMSHERAFEWGQQPKFQLENRMVVFRHWNNVFPSLYGCFVISVFPLWTFLLCIQTSSFCHHTSFLKNQKQYLVPMLGGALRVKLWRHLRQPLIFKGHSVFKN